MLSRLSLADSTIIGVTPSKAFIVLFVWNLSPVLQYQFFEYDQILLSFSLPIKRAGKDCSKTVYFFQLPLRLDMQRQKNDSLTFFDFYNTFLIKNILPSTSTKLAKTNNSKRSKRPPDVYQLFYSWPVVNLHFTGRGLLYHKYCTQLNDVTTFIT